MENNSENNNKKPKHVAIIMDGNGRWATKRTLPRVSGHKQAIRAVRESIEFAIENDIKALTLFAFGMENWNRPRFEVNALMTLFSSTLKSELKNLQKNNVKFLLIGDKNKLSSKLQAEILHMESSTSANTGLNLNIAISYSGKWDIVESCKHIANKFKLGDIKLEDINEDLISRNLSLGDMPDPDLLIRTSGEHRLSNFLLWQLAYSELYFSNILWPDFSKEDFAKAIDFYVKRERRFGLTSDQINEESTAANSTEEAFID